MTDDNLLNDILRDREAGTPGPWIQGSMLPHACEFSFYDIFIPDGTPIACVSGDRQSEADPVDIFNARRIARAPDMEARIIADADRIEALEAENAKLRDAMQMADEAMTIEINPSNYDHDDVCRLNAESINASLILRAALTGDKP